MGIVGQLGRVGFGIAVASVLLSSSELATAATCQVIDDVVFVNGDGTAYAPADAVNQFATIIGQYYSATLYPSHNGHLAAYETSPGGGTVYFLRYTDGTWVTSSLAQDVWMCANDYSTYFQIMTGWDAFGLACQNCQFYLGPVNYNGKKFGIDTMAGDDTVYGGAGEDWMFGNDGNDTLNGGGGTDYAFGGAGTDSADGTTEDFFQ